MANTIINGGASPYPKHVGPAPICSFSDGAQDAPLKSLKFYISPNQDLHGYDYPWPGGGGVNQLPAPADTTVTSNGITCTVKNGVYALSGTATATAEFIFDLPADITLDANTQKIAFLNTAADRNVSVYFRQGYTNVHNWQTYPANRVTTWTATTTETVNKVRIIVSSGATVSMTISPMLMLKTKSDPTSFSPYSNISPISGWSQVDGVAAGKNLIDVTFSTVNASNIITNTFSLKAGTYTLSIKYNGTPTYCVYIRNGSTIQATSVVYWYNATTQTFTLDKGYDTLCISIYYGNGITPSEVSEVMIVQGSTASPYAAPTLTPITIALGQTVYGAREDALAGKMAITHDYTELSTLSWTRITNGSVYIFDTTVPDFTPTATSSDAFLSTHYTPMPNTEGYGLQNGQCARGTGGRHLYVRDDAYTTAADFKAAAAGKYICYPLATPIEVDLTPVSVSSLLGQNNIWASCGDTELDYYPAAASVVAVLNRSSKVYTSIPLGKIRYDTYQTTPNQALDLDSYRAETGVLIRNVLSHTATKIEFNTPSMTNLQWEEVWNIIKAGFNNSTERKLKLKYYDQMSATYKTGWFYVPDVNFTIRNIDEANGIINYDEVRVAFIEY